MAEFFCNFHPCITALFESIRKRVKIKNVNYLRGEYIIIIYSTLGMSYQNKIFDLTLLLFIMAVLGSIELKNFFLDFSDPVLIPPQPVKGFP